MVEVAANKSYVERFESASEGLVESSRDLSLSDFITGIKRGGCRSICRVNGIGSFRNERCKEHRLSNGT